MLKTLLVILLLVASVQVQAQDFKFIPLRHDKLWSEDGLIIRYDAVEHALRDGALFWGLGKFGVKDSWRFGATTAFAVAWEVRDGFRWRHTDGFSWKDLFAGMAGQVIVFGGEKLFSKPKSQKYDEALRQELRALEFRIVELERRNTDKIGDTLE